jgi:hypothetical protein
LLLRKLNHLCVDRATANTHLVVRPLSGYG